MSATRRFADDNPKRLSGDCPAPCGGIETFLPHAHASAGTIFDWCQNCGWNEAAHLHGMAKSQPDPAFTGPFTACGHHRRYGTNPGVFGPVIGDADKRFVAVCADDAIRARIISALNTVEPPELLICAALLMPDGYIVRGHRHSTCYHVAAQVCVEKKSVDDKTYYVRRWDSRATNSAVQGALTSRNRFVDRDDATRLFLANGGVLKLGSVWTSEESW